MFMKYWYFYLLSFFLISGLFVYFYIFKTKAFAEDITSVHALNCEKVADLPLNNNKIYRCENTEVLCYITAPEAQEQCQFKN